MTITEQAADSGAKTCSIDGCEDPGYARGWCRIHYNRWRLNGDTPGTPSSPPRPACSIEGCGKPGVTRGWCSKHYQRWQVHGDPLGATPAAPLCSIEGCGKARKSRGWCAMHYQRWQVYSDPLWTPPAPRELCSVEGCEKSNEARGWCKKHYQRWRSHGDPLVLLPPGAPLVAAPTYSTVHARLRSELHPSMLRCDHCGGQAEEWAYDHADPAELTSPEGSPYSADPRHYVPLCCPCHRRFDNPSSLSEAAKVGAGNGA